MDGTHGARAMPTLVALTDALRRAGLRVSREGALVATRALSRVDLARRSDVRDALRATLVSDRADLETFDLVFELLYPASPVRPGGTAPALPRSRDVPPAPAGRRVASALPRHDVRSAPRPDRLESTAYGSASDRERLADRDFDQMTREELAAARRLLHAAPVPAAPRRSRRYRATARGRSLDLRATLRRAVARAPAIEPSFRARRRVPRDGVLLLDVSGSMAGYARMALHLAWAYVHAPARVEVFTFGTRLTRITAALRASDPDVAVHRASRAVIDWDGGTRIGSNLAAFNRLWGRRVLTRAPWITLLTDGLDRGDIPTLEREVARLARSGRALVWLNPLMRSATYEPLAAGAGVIARYATRAQPAHSVRSLEALAALLADSRRDQARRSRMVTALTPGAP
jgi:hypothetical protein